MWQKSPSFARNIRTTGQQLRSDVLPIPQWSPDDLSGGMGRRYYRNGTPQCYFATAHTLWPRQVTLPLLANSSTGTAIGNQTIVKMVEFKGVLYGFFIDAGSLYITPWNGVETWGTPVLVDANNISGIIGAYDCNGTLVIFYYDTSNLLLCTHCTTVGGGWAATVVTGSNLSASCYNSHDGYLYYTTAVSGEVTLYTSSNKGTSFSSITSSTIFSGTGPTGLAMFNYNNGARVPMISTPEAVYAAVSAPTTGRLVEVVNLRGVLSSANGLGLTEWNQYLIVPLSNGAMVAYGPDGSVTPLGINSGDGFPTDYMGEFTTLLADQQYLFAAVSAQKSGIYVFDGKGWFTIWSGDAQYNIVALAAYKKALLFSPGQGMYRHINYYFTNPMEVPGATYGTEGFVLYPVFGGELPEVLAGFVKLSTYSHNLSVTETILASVSIDDEPWKDLGLFSDVTDSFIPNLQGKDIQLKLTLSRGDNTYKTPILHYPILSVNKSGSWFRTLTLELDIPATAAAISHTQEQVLANLDALVASPALTKIEIGKSITYCILSTYSLAQTEAGYKVRIVAEQAV